MKEVPALDDEFAKDISEFDTLDELREFDTSYVCDTRSEILKHISSELDCKEKDITEVTAYKTENNSAAGIHFRVKNTSYEYNYQTRKIRRNTYG